MTLNELYKIADYKDDKGICFLGDCLDVMKNIPDKSIDMILCDLPLGSGSTCIASKQLNRKYIGVELDKQYFDIAVERLKNEC